MGNRRLSCRSGGLYDFVCSIQLSVSLGTVLIENSEEPHLGASCVGDDYFILSVHSENLNGMSLLVL